MSGDPRPLTSEPLALDLVNTMWKDADGRHDLLATPDGLRRWLQTAGLPAEVPHEAALPPLAEAREAIGRAVRAPQDPRVDEALDAVLGHGHLHLRAGPGGVQEALEVDQERWRIPWLAVRDLLRLRDQAPDRLRPCADPGCVLVFYDGSRNGRRQWCSMAACGNRAKARRHHARTHATS